MAKENKQNSEQSSERAKGKGKASAGETSSASPSLLTPPKPPAKGEMSARELRIAGYTTQGKRVPKTMLAFLMVLVVVFICGLVGYFLRGGVAGITPRTIVAQKQEKSEKLEKRAADDELIPSGSVADGKLTAAITGTPAIKDGVVSFTVKWVNKGSNSTYTPSAFVVSQNGSPLQSKAGHYGEEVLPGQQREVTYTYNLLNKKDDVKVILGKGAKTGGVDKASKLVGTVIKVRGE